MGSVLSIARKLKVYMVAIIGEALQLEKDDFETENQMEQVDEMTRNIRTFLEDEMRRKRHFCSEGFNSNACEVSGQRESNLSNAAFNFYTYMLSECIKDAPIVLCSGGSNSNYAYEVSPQRMSTLRDIIEALTDANVTIIGVYGTHSIENANLLEKFIRRAKRDNLFDMIVMASVTRKPDFRRIQGELADAFGLTMEEKKVAERARHLRDRIKMEQKILVVMQDLCKGLDLEKIGIPFGADHTGCKILLTSTSEEILSNQMHAQKVFIWK